MYYLVNRCTNAKRMKKAKDTENKRKDKGNIMMSILATSARGNVPTQSVFKL